VPETFVDHNFGELSVALGLFDEQLAEVERAIHRAVSIRLGCPEWFEHSCGHGFVACQTYMTKTFGRLDVPKATALAVAPEMVVATINRAASLWKR
jgi:hypothetical protein